MGTRHSEADNRCENECRCECPTDGAPGYAEPLTAGRRQDGCVLSDCAFDAAPCRGRRRHRRECPGAIADVTEIAGKQAARRTVLEVPLDVDPFGGGERPIDVVADDELVGVHRFHV